MVQGGLTRGYRGLPRPVRARGGRRLGWNLVRWSGRRYGWSLFGLLGWLAVGFSLRRRRRVRGRLRDLGAAFHGDSLAQNLASGLPGIIGRTVRTKAGRTATRGRWEKGQASSRRSKASRRSVRRCSRAGRVSEGPGMGADRAWNRPLVTRTVTRLRAARGGGAIQPLDPRDIRQTGLSAAVAPRPSSPQASRASMVKKS